SVTQQEDGVTGDMVTGVQTSAPPIYTAPATVQSTTTVTVTAVSQADPTKSASAQVTITPTAAVNVTISPTSATVATGGTQQFTDIGRASSRARVKCQVSGGTGDRARA